MEEFKNNNETKVPKEQCGIRFKNASFRWGFRVSQDQSKNPKGNIKVAVDEVTEPTVFNLNLEMAYNSCLMVCGKIGSGKTTLLHSIMSETSQCGGDVDIKGKVAYVE